MSIALFLASGSPRRRELLTQIGVPFTAISAPVDETPLAGEAAQAYVERLALAKALAGQRTLSAEQRGTGPVVLGCDTAVIVDGRILGKPVDESDALAMLSLLSGRSHDVFTAIALVDEQRQQVRSVTSRVQMRVIDSAEARRYWASGEPRDKAGSYAIQGLAAIFVESLQGSYSAVVGLPLCETAQALAEFGVTCWQ